MHIKSKDNETNLVEVDAYIPQAKPGGLTLLLINFKFSQK